MTPQSLKKHSALPRGFFDLDTSCTTQVICSFIDFCLHQTYIGALFEPYEITNI